MAYELGFGVSVCGGRHLFTLLMMLSDTANATSEHCENADSNINR